MPTIVVDSTGIPSDWVGKMEVDSITMSPSGLGTLVANGNGNTGQTRVWMLVTRDGGRRWSPMGGGLPVADTVVFADASHGFVVGTSLATTTDGGQRWTSVAVPGGAWASRLAVAGDNAWVVTEACDQGNVTCVPTFSSLPIGGGALTPLPHQPAVRAPALVTQLVRPDAQSAYVITADDHGDDAVVEILVTHDGGRGWSSLKPPCPASATAPTLSANGNDDLWLRCYTGHDATRGTPFATSLFHSHDGGSSWRPEGATDAMFGTVTSVGGGTLWADESNLRTGTGGYVVRSTDGGRTWTVALPPTGESTMRFSGVLTATDAQSAWYAAIEADTAGEHVVLYRTTDAGAHWARSVLGR